MLCMGAPPFFVCCGEKLCKNQVIIISKSIYFYYSKF